MSMVAFAAFEAGTGLLVLTAPSLFAKLLLGAELSEPDKRWVARRHRAPRSGGRLLASLPEPDTHGAYGAPDL